jgi:hypothetical protein
MTGVSSEMSSSSWEVGQKAAKMEGRHIGASLSTSPQGGNIKYVTWPTFRGGRILCRAEAVGKDRREVEMDGNTDDLVT